MVGDTKFFQCPSTSLSINPQFTSIKCGTKRVKKMQKNLNISIVEFPEQESCTFIKRLITSVNI